MWKISSHSILLPIILIILAFPNNNKAEDQLNQSHLKKATNVKVTSPAVVQTNKMLSLTQIKKSNSIKSIALNTMLTTGIMAGHNSFNNFMERNGVTAGHIKSKIGINNQGSTEILRGNDKNLKNAKIIPSKTNGTLANLLIYAKQNWPSQMNKENMAKFEVGWSKYAENLRKMDEIKRKEWKNFDGKKLNALEDGQNKELIEGKEKENVMDWMNKIKNIGLNSAKKLTNYLTETWINRNQIDIEIGANIGAEMTENMIKIGEIMKKILEIDVNVKIDSMKNENGKNDGIGMQLKFFNGQIDELEHREIKIPLLFDKHGKMEMNPMELGKELIRQICGGNECDQPDDLPQFGANPCSAKPPPELHELDRSLRPMLLKLGSKLNKGFYNEKNIKINSIFGRLWTDNPMPDYKNGFYVAFDWDPLINSSWLPLLKAQLERFERNAPIRFIGLQNGKIESSKFKNQLYFVIHSGKSWTDNDGLNRNTEKNVVYLNRKELEDCNRYNYIQIELLKALGINAGEGLRIEYDRRDKHMPYFRRAFAQLNAAYGAENYSIQGQPFLLYENKYNILLDKPEVEFWMGTEYANFATRKYEIPVVYDESFKEMANQNQELLEEIYANFANNSVIQFVVYKVAPENKNYVRIYRADKDYSAHAFVGRSIKRDSSYQGEFMEIGKNSMDKYTLYHELMHVAGMDHEHQRADVEKYLGVDRQKAQNMFSYNGKIKYLLL